MENNSNLPPKPNNYLVLAILSTIFCCLATGIASIIYASKVNEAYARGDYEEAVKASKNAKMWVLIGAGLSALIWIIYIAIFGFAFLGAMSNAGSY
ncbi:CD225/dispanin family protein [Flagellimonas pacifica]|uniref:Interferon-induced transmembrane protein n=1 Tax=Flagellimonas pacifica TaxID=1247520 RepID=A0A285MT67_9FLAO|nr:CD225/dispanin family protein [Allomuricauda parva]SNZ00328.1 Interferon-induced transmembrane protein [Allomuricauda parva]